MARSRRSKGLKDKAYLAFIGSLACLCCKRWDTPQVTRTEVAHVGERGLSQKCSDRETIPLCGCHHRTGNTSHHRLGKLFWEHHKLDRDSIIAALNQEYERNA